ncbi:hypothetical protein [Flavobacterium sp. UMI-01]|uniref:hypothetical protein n=1 Tax=Flavobacterium sp. UMI-01 TaxID=1441053 RepID=UPI001C7E1B85|nr:hypothetical protein [Flavobacterium sp. UMI-01]GIZ07901.1 hypothetical protein FUMI01_06280 [Flavobacterium sp. UMI-01]
MTPEQIKILEQLGTMGEFTFIKNGETIHDLIVKAISVMDIDQLKILTENYLPTDKKEEFLKNIKTEFKANKDTHLIAHSGICNSTTCN